MGGNLHFEEVKKSAQGATICIYYRSAWFVYALNEC